MKNKDKNKKFPREIDKQANVRAGGFHETYAHEFQETQVPNPPSGKDFTKHQQENPKGHYNKNYGWKQGFDHSESYGSELKKPTDGKSKTSRGGRTGFGGRNR